jgi:hypothetical protein
MVNKVAMELNILHTLSSPLQITVSSMPYVLLSFGTDNCSIRDLLPPISPPIQKEKKSCKASVRLLAEAEFHLYSGRGKKRIQRKCREINTLLEMILHTFNSKS